MIQTTNKDTVEINLKLPSLNEYTRVCRGNAIVASKFKRDIELKISYFLVNMKKYEKPIFINFNWIEKNKKRDLDNIAFAKKFILDAMVKTKKIKNDGWQYVAGFSDKFSLGKETKVVLEIFH